MVNNKPSADAFRGVVHQETAKRIVDLAPDRPGCYLFFDGRRFVIYAGKSKNLKNRMRQYFHTRDTDWRKIREMVGNIREVAFLTTASELDALLLEHRLIKAYKPRYNAQLKSDRGGLFLRVSGQEDFPFVGIVTGRKEDGAAYYGGVRDAFDGERILETLNAVWRLPLCEKESFPATTAPCLYHHLGQCDAPCVGGTGRQVWGERIREVRDFLAGESEEILNKLEKQMNRKTEHLSFEQAAEIRDQIHGLKRIRRRIGGFLPVDTDETILLFLRPYRADHFSIFLLRAGALLGRRNGAARTPQEALVAMARTMVLSPPAKGVRPVRPRSVLSSDAAFPFTASQLPKADEAGLVKALCEIYVERYFISLPPAEDSEQMTETIRTAFTDFFSENPLKKQASANVSEANVSETERKASRGREDRKDRRE